VEKSLANEIAEAVSDVQAGEEMREILLRRLREMALEHEAASRALYEAISRLER
jgi:cytidylate kinase